MRLSTTLLVLSAITGTAPAQLSFTEIFAFGDSLTDTGNLFAATGQPAPPYYQGRFSNGPVWVDQLAWHLQIDRHHNFAVGGSTSNNVLGQVNTLLASRRAIPGDALVALWVGANDLFPVLAGASSAQAALQNAMTNVATAIANLSVRGARHFVVPNLPDLGATPRVAAGGATAARAARSLCISYNNALAQVLAQLEAQLPIRIARVDAFALLDQLIQAPGQFELSNVTQPALAPSGVVVAQPNTHLFWDDLHPTYAAHWMVRQAALAALRATGARGSSARVGG